VRRRAALAGLRAYQHAERRPRPPAMPAIASAGRAAVRDYGGAGPPVLFVPSLINPPHVLDLTESNSFLRWLAGEGVRPLLVDWGTPSPAERDLDIAGHIETLLVPLIDAIGERVAMTGYCLGGTMALAAAIQRPPTRLALIAAPWRFSGYPAQACEDMRALWRQAAPAAELMGLLPIEVLQAGFWQLDPARVIAKFEAFATMDPESAEAQGFVALEDWANDGPPLTLAAARDLMDRFYLDDLTGRNAWHVGGRLVDPSSLTCPVLDIVSTTDRIVPAASAAGVGERLTLALGHVGMIVGGRAREVLQKPLAAWLSRLHNS